MSERLPLVLGEDGLLEVLQPEDTIWPGLLLREIADGDGIRFSDGTFLLSEEGFGAIIESDADVLLVIRHASNDTEFHFTSDGLIVLPQVSIPVSVVGALMFDGHDLYFGRE